ncbi:MAG: GNAT family N-acetyltransferase [Bacteroidales bacterium]|jgi:long-subunit acyl-CoA synthetase (AMP-forming)/predicted GNAT family acetyltransferase
MSAFTDLLNRWKTRNPSQHSDAELALLLLQEAGNDLSAEKADLVDRESWIDFLDTTKKPDFLKSLKNDSARIQWAEVVFKILQHAGYNLRDMMDSRVREHSDKILFREMASPNPVEWSYEQIQRHLREIAAVFYHTVKVPRVAIYSDNCLEGACTDLACLCHGIFDTPLSFHFSADVLLHIFDLLKINIVVTDSKERFALLLKVKTKAKTKFKIFTLSPWITKEVDSIFLQKECKKLSGPEITRLLNRNADRKNTEVATTMFTSGSTGLPKGVSFSIYNIVSKRYARAAALPDAGEEVFLCYLPLFHTFGRYLEMIGTIFWSGTYTFAGNSSAETLFALFPKINPTGFISIPLRWQELYELCQEKVNHIENVDLREQAVREVVGHRLSWGLSAAGYLDPVVFRFFNQYGISLCSGFGMTEATGGITMTPPGHYREMSVGIPLPGVRTRLTSDSELEISGHYIGIYIEEAGPGDDIPYPDAENKTGWLSTGDVFTVTEDGYYEIIDRIKDIYKNNRGQTVAPQVIEKKFYKVPGIKNTFVVGDGRPYNVLLISPDKEDLIYKDLSGENLNEYFHQIIMAANADAAPYERVINFTLLDRHFSSEMGELTPKGSFNRKTIEKNFLPVIETLYTSNIVAISCGDFNIRIPRWVFRDLGILENDILYENGALFDRRNKHYLHIRKTTTDSFEIGDLQYKITSTEIDLGTLARQPKLWLGNPQLVAFCPVKEGWDLPLGAISDLAYFVQNRNYKEKNLIPVKAIRTQELQLVHHLISRALFLPADVASEAINELGKLYTETDPRLAMMIRLRMEALAYHPEGEIRTLAYRTILLKAPDPEQIQNLTIFIESGLSFLNEKSIREIASGNFGKHRLDALKQRLYWYRTNMEWPANEMNQQQFESVLRMLFNFAVEHLEFYVSVRAELSRWILLKKDPYLSKKAGEYFNHLAEVFEKSMESMTNDYPHETWQKKILFEYGMQEMEKERILKIFQSTTYLAESIILAFNEKSFNLDEVPNNGIWVLRLQAYKEFRHYRLSINTKSSKHYDLHMVMSENPDFRPKPDTFYWLASLAGFPYGPPVGPFLGSSRPNLGILSTQYIGGLTAWDKIREFAEIHKSAGYVYPNAWKKVFTKAFTVIFRAWHHSGFQIVPGLISPNNVVVPEMDFRQSAVIVSLTGWTTYRNTVSLVGPILQDFYCKTAALYPWCSKHLEVSWIFDACIEALGREEAIHFLETLKKDLEQKPVYYFDDGNLTRDLEKYFETIAKKYYLPLALYSAIDQYAEWYKMNPLTTYAAKEQTLFELLELYKLHECQEIVRYYFYRHSYFMDAADIVKTNFDKLLEKMMAEPTVLPIQLMELSALQSVIAGNEDKDVFSRMVFPRLMSEQKIDFMKVGERLKEHVVVKFLLTDKTGTKYIQRDPIEPREIGQLYQLFFRENYPKEISDADHHYVVTDNNDKIIGGMTWRNLDNNNVLLDGVVVTSSLQGKGIASGMIENFFTSMAARGIKIVKAHFLLGNYYLKHYFEVDKKWGALVKRLND